MADSWQLKAVLSAVDKLSPVLKQVGGVAQSTRKYLGDVAKSAGNVGTKLGLPVAALSGVISGFSLMAVKNAVVGFTEMGEAVQKGALKAGMSVEQYQRMKYVAEQSGTSIEAMEGSLSKLNRQMGDAAAGKNKDIAGLMSRLGIKMRDANGNIRSGVDLLPQLADAFQRNKNPAIQARMGMALFGKSYAEILPLLSEGSKGIEDNIKRFDKIKGVLGDGDIKDAKDLGDSFKDLDLVMKGFQGTIAKSLVPVLEPLIKQFTAWWVVNKKLVASKVSEMAKDLAAWIKTIDFGKLLNDVGDFLKSIGTLIGWLGGAKNALIALVLFMNAGAIMAMVEMGGAVLRLVGWLGGPLLTVLRAVWAVMIANPIGLLIAAVVGLAAIIYSNWDNIVAYVSSAWERIKAVFDVNFFDGLIQVWLEAWQGMANGIIGIVKTLTPDFLMSDAMRNFQFSFASDRAAGLTSGDRPSLVSQQAKGRVDGQVNINIAGLPQGSRVEQVAGGGNMPLNLSAGYRYDALGMP